MNAAGLVATEHVAETGSTNADLLELVRHADPAQPFAPRLLVAGTQTAGRGRHGRTWHGTAGSSLTFSLAWPLPAVDAAGLSLAVGVALAEALDPVPGRLRIGLKWPNDLWLVDAPRRAREAESFAGRKLGGVLIETMALGSGRVAVIGVGLNIGAQHVGEAASGVAWLREIDAGATPASTLERMRPALVAALRDFEHEGWSAFAARFEARDLLMGRSVVAGAVEGIAAGVSARGALLLRSVAGVQAIDSGEVRLRLGSARASTARAPHDANAATLAAPC